MRKRLIMVGLMLMLISPLAKAQAANPEGPETLPPDRIEKQDGGTEDDCECCQKCRAAKKPIQPLEEPGSTKKNGCEDCCERCGKPLTPIPEAPPDIIEKPNRR